MLYGFNPGFPRLFLCTGQIVHALLTRPPLSIFRKIYLVRLACVRHAASVRPEPGSNSRLIFLLKITHSIIFCLSLLLLFLFSYYRTPQFRSPIYKIGNSLRMTYHQSFSPCSRKNWVRASSKVSYAVLLSKFSAVFCDSFSSLSYTFMLVNYQFFLLFFSLSSMMTTLLV